MNVLDYTNSRDFIYKDSPTIVTIGNFDGFHKGHRILIEWLNETKLHIGAKSLVFSFRPRPVEVFNNTRIKSILSTAERVEIANSLGVDILMEYPFSLEFSRMSGEEFIKNVLIEQLGCKWIVVGEGFAFGKDRAWYAAKISEICAKLGIEFIALPHKLMDNKKISSTNIREYLKSGEIKKANMLLGYDYYVLGELRKISEKKTMLTIAVDEQKLLPESGRYISEISLKNGKKFQSTVDVDDKMSMLYISLPVEHGDNNFSSLYCGDTIIVNFQDYAGGKIK